MEIRATRIGHACKNCLARKTTGTSPFTFSLRNSSVAVAKLEIVLRFPCFYCRETRRDGDPIGSVRTGLHHIEADRADGRGRSGPAPLRYTWRYPITPQPSELTISSSNPIR